MRKFTTLFLLALAMTIGANQAFAKGHGSSNDNGRSEQSDSERDDDGNKSDPITAADSVILLRPCLAVRPCFTPPRRPKLVVKDSEECSCVHKVMRVNGRFMPFIDCYQPTEINGHQQLRYCTK
jgi:hypothetical protein